MVNKAPFLSICIPTWEVREQARKTLINIGEFYETVGTETKIG